MATGDCRNILLQLIHRFFLGNIEREASDSGVVQMGSLLGWENGGYSPDATRLVFLHQRLADASLATASFLSQ